MANTHVEDVKFKDIIDAVFSMDESCTKRDLILNWRARDEAAEARVQGQQRDFRTLQENQNNLEAKLDLLLKNFGIQ